MKIIYSISILAAFAGMALTSCSNDDISDVIAPSKGEKITVQAYTGAQTRMGYEDNGTGVAIKWTEGDSFRVIPAKTGADSEVFELTAGANTNAGTFSGYVPDIDEDGYSVVYPASLADEAAFSAFSYSGQTQNGNDNTAHLTAFHTMKYKVDGTRFADINFGAAGVEQSSMLVLNLENLPVAIGTPKEIDINADEACLATANNAVSDAASLSLEGFDAISENSNSIKAYMMLGVNAENKKLSSGKTLTVTVVGSGATYNAVITAAADVCFAGGKRNSVTANSWEVAPEKIEPYVFDMSDAANWGGGTVSLLDDGGLDITTSNGNAKRCDVNMTGFKMAISDLAKGCLYYRAKAKLGTQVSAGDAKFALFIDGKRTVGDVESTIKLAQYKGELLGVDKDGYSWFVFEWGKLGTEGHTCEIVIRKPGDTKDTTYKPGADEYDAWMAEVKKAFEDGSTFSRLNFIIMSDWTGSDKETFTIKEVGINTRKAVQDMIQ